jgi:hypothetical protein
MIQELIDAVRPSGQLETGDKGTIELCLGLMNIFSRHIGANQAIDMPGIYAKLYGALPISKYQYIFRCQKILHCMTLLRKKTNYFIVGASITDTFKWYVVKTPEEADAYINGLDARIKGLEIMKTRCRKAVREQFYLRLEEQNGIKKLANN